LLSKIDLEKLSLELEYKLNESSLEAENKSLQKQKDIVEAFLLTGSHPKNSALSILPVAPLDVRPFAIINKGEFLLSDLNELYRNVIHRNNRLKRLIELEAPEIIINNEKRMLQEAVDGLFDNGLNGRRPVLGQNERALCSLFRRIPGSPKSTTRSLAHALDIAHFDSNDGKKQYLKIFTSKLKGLLFSLDEVKDL